MTTKFKKGQKVNYVTPKARNTGTGKVVDIFEGLRGAFYEIKDAASGAVYKLRAANLTAV